MLLNKYSSLLKRVTRRRYPFFIAMLMLASTAQVCAVTSIEEVRQLAGSGVPQLAIAQIDIIQKDLDTQQSEWLSWEKERLDLYKNNMLWAQLNQRVDSYPAGVDSLFLRQARTSQLEALLKLGKAATAREYAHQLIWSETLTDADEVWLPLWQRLIMQSYIQQSMSEDAFLASQRFYQQYRSEEASDKFTRARILLMNQRAGEVLELLDKHTQSPEGGMLYLLAQLRSKARTPQKVMQAAYRQMRGKWVDKQLKYNLWAVVAEASRLAGDRNTTVEALEYVLARQSTDYLASGMYRFRADNLWNAYIDNATYVANQEQLLIGDDASWLKKANEFASKQSISARSLYALLMLKASQAGVRQKAVEEFINIMRKTKGGADLIQVLFLESSHYSRLERVPALVRYDLADISLSRSDIQQASRIMATLNEAPAGTDAFDWQLRRARILVMGARSAEAEKALLQLLRENKKLKDKQMDRLLQVVFDMQTVSAHANALGVFRAIIEKNTDKEFLREMYFWMADSEKALGNHSQAAFWYLRSALLLDGKGLDPWGQTARYHAAESLAKAGMLDDARNLYEFLLRTTREEARRAVLKHALQKLSLHNATSLDDEAGEVEAVNNL